MKLVSFSTAHDPAVRAGVYLTDHVVDLHRADKTLPRSMVDVLQLGDEGQDTIRRALAGVAGRVPVERVRLHEPVRPGKFFAVGLNYADHIAEAGLDVPTNMTVFAKAPSCVTGPFDVIERPFVSEQLDYEGELGFVIGRRCRHVSAADAASVIAGYVVINDVSVRDWQTRTPQWNLGKSFDTHGPIGPWIVTADELVDPHSLAIRTFVNGVLRQQSTTSNLIFDCFDQVAILSTVCTLEPGDVVATGTPSGVAMHMPGQPWLVPGDVVRVEIDSVGSIENRVVDEQRPSRVPATTAGGGTVSSTASR